MNYKITRLVLATLLACVLGGILLPERASAQLMVRLDIDEPKFVRHQDITATLTVLNRSGRDFILEGPNESSWLSFEVTDPKQKIVPMKAGAPKIKPLLVRTGETVTKTVPLSMLYRFDHYGIYGVTANVYYSPTRQYLSSSRRTLTITDGSTFWEETVGVPEGQVGAGEYRKISLLIHKENQSARLFMRVTDPQSTRVLGTRFLGKILAFRDPQVTIDVENRIHVLFLSSPKTWLHTIALPDGSVLQPETYSEDGSNRPSMLLSKTGRVSIHGGFYSGGSKLVGGDRPDPALSSEKKPERRTLSDRPGAILRAPESGGEEPLIPRATIVE